MPEAVTEGNGQPDKNAFDLSKLKQDIIDAMASNSASLKDTILAEVKTQLDHRLAEKPSPKKTEKKSTEISEDLKDLQDEIKALDIDDKTAGALTSMMSKILNKKSGDLKNEVKGEIELTAKAKETKQGWDALAVKNFPQIQKQDSMLAKEATKIYQNNLSKACKESPEGSLVAVLLAALMTGERPITVEEVRQQEARNEGSGGSGGGSDKGVESSKVDELAKGFGLDPAKVQAQLKKIKSKKQMM